MISKELEVMRDDKPVAHNDDTYGIRNDNFLPSAYRKMLVNSTAAVAIAINNKPIGSGTLIGDQVVLTCRHGIDNVFNDQGTVRPNFSIDVWCDFDFNGQEKIPKESFEVEKILWSGQQAADPDGNNIEIDNVKALDFLLLKLKQTPSDSKYIRPALSLRSPLQNEPVYVVGYPKGNPCTIHDNARILFPFRVSEYTYNKLRLKVFGEMVNRHRRFDLPDELNDRRDYMANFENCYVKFGSHYYHYSLNWKTPLHAISSDTFVGNSGSGTFSKATNNLIGVFIKGGSETGDANRAGWQHHEVCIPITEIIRQVDRPKPAGLGPDWAEKLGVKVKE